MVYQSGATWALAAAPALPERAAQWAEAERGRFAPWLAVALIAGAAAYFSLSREPSASAGPAAACFSIALCVLTWRWPAPRAAALMLAAAALGFASGQLRTGRAPPMDELPSRAAILTATVRGVDALADGRRMVLEDVRLAPDATPLRRMVRVRIKRGDTAAVSAGDVVKVRALLRPPFPPSYPGGWDQQRDAFFNGLAGGGTALNPVVVIEHTPPRGWAGWVQGLRDGIAARTRAAIPGAPGAIAATLLTGSTFAIPPDDRAAFRDAGLAHLLAVSGLHMGIVMGLFMFAARFGLALWPHAALHWPVKALSAGVALAAGAACLALTGVHVPVIRSFAMACLVTLAVVVGRRALSLRGLALGAAALVLISPQEVTGPSFQMSFAAVLALVAGYEALRPALARLHGPGWRRVAGHGAALVLTSLLAGTASAPFGAYHFGHIQLYFIAANLVAVPLTATLVMPLGVLGLFLMPLGLEQVALWPMGWGIKAILYVAHAVSSWPAATLPAPPMPGWGLAVFGLGFAWLCLWRTRVRLLGVAVMLAGLLSPLAAPLPDMLVSNDARLIAIRAPEGYRLQARPGASKFVRSVWAEHLGEAALLPINAGSPAFCDAEVCRMGSVLLLRDATREADCTGVSLVVSAEPARDVCPGAALLDRFTVWRDGAFAVWLQPGGPAMLSDRASRGDRPWVPPPPKPRRATPNLPMAPAETLPPELEDNG